MNRNNFRIGQGFDVHRLVTGRDLILGGVSIPFEKGLEGHSDADVVLHAISDALLGAAGLGDIGLHFPSDDEKYRDADSADLLREVHRMVNEAGYRAILNLDSVIMAERPKLRPYVQTMRDSIAGILKLNPARVSIKATTTEGLGFTGREEGIAATAVCLIAADE